MGGAAVTLPANPGTYITLFGQRATRPTASVAETVAIPIVADWGPLGSEEIVKSENFGEYESAYGDSDTPGRDAVLGAFIGTGVAGMAAAGAVKTYRMATGSAAKAKLVIKNTHEAAENALEVLARYTGSRGNRISVKVAVDAVDSNKHRLSVLFDGIVKESFGYAKANIAEAAEKINNANSPFITAVSLKSGTTLATTAGTALASGNDGSTLTSTQWLQATEALEFEDFSVFAPFDCTDQSIVASLFSWTVSQSEEMRPVFSVFGGETGEELTEAIERVAEIEDPHVVAIGGGDYHDAFLDKDVTTSQLAPRIAGILAGLGEEKSLLNVPVAGLKQIGTSLISPDELATATEHGVTVFRRTTIPEAELVIANGITTFTDDSDPNRPLELFSDPRIVRVADLFIRRMKQWGDKNIVGPTTVTEETEAAVRDRGNSEIAELVRRNLILPGVTEDERPFFRVIDSGGLPAIVFQFGFMFARTTKYLIGQGMVR